MADIELVIKIPEEHYNAVKNGQNGEPYNREFVDAIVNGTPLPKTDLFDDVRADVLNIADGKQTIKVRSILQIIDKHNLKHDLLNDLRADIINIADSRRSIPVRHVINNIAKHKAESEISDADND